MSNKDVVSQMCLDIVSCVPVVAIVARTGQKSLLNKPEILSHFSRLLYIQMISEMDGLIKKAIDEKLELSAPQTLRVWHSIGPVMSRIMQGGAEESPNVDLAKDALYKHMKKD